jgi:hypothetical protein
MHGGCYSFFGIVKTPLVRNGADERIRGGTLQVVYSEMLLQICRDYPGVPDPRTLTASEIRFFYNGLRAELKAHTKPK